MRLIPANILRVRLSAAGVQTDCKDLKVQRRDGLTARQLASSYTVHRMRVVYNKLVRDQIPKIIEAAGHQPVTRVLDKRRYTEALLANLLEEACEAHAAPAQQVAEELADVLEVLRSLASALGVTWEQIVDLAAAKRSQRGGFERRLLLST